MDYMVQNNKLIPMESLWENLQLFTQPLMLLFLKLQDKLYQQKEESLKAIKELFKALLNRQTFHNQTKYNIVHHSYKLKILNTINLDPQNKTQKQHNNYLQSNKSVIKWELKIHNKFQHFIPENMKNNAIYVNMDSMEKKLALLLKIVLVNQYNFLVVYQTPEVLVSQSVGQPLTARNTTTVQNFSQLINTPPRNDFAYSQQLQQSPIQNIQLNVPQTQIQQQIIPQVSQQNYVVQQIPQVQNYQITTGPQQIIQETITTVQEQQLSPQEQVETYWRFKVYELQERVYELMNQISLQKQGNLQHQRTGSQVKKSTEDSFKVEQAKQEILQLESQLKIKQKSSIDLRNKLNVMIYKQDPTDEATKYKEQELQQLRQKYNTLNFKNQSNIEDIAMTQAIIEAVKSGKGYKLVSVREQQQTSSYNQQYQGQQQYNQVK